MVESSIYSASATANRSPRRRQIGSFFRDELRPLPGRLRAALVRVAGVVLGMWAAFAIDVPEVSAVLALAFFASSTEPAEGKKVAFGVPPIVLIIYLLVTLALSVFGASPLVRTVILFAIIFASMFLLQAAKNGAVFMLAAVFGKVFLTLYDDGYPSQILQYLQLWIVGDLALAGVCAFIAFSLFGNTGKSPTEIFRKKLAGQFDTVARILEKPSGPVTAERATLHADALSAPDNLLLLLDAAAKKDKSIKAESDRFAHLARLAVLLQHECLVLTAHTATSSAPAPHTLRWIADRCTAIARAVRSATPVSPSTNAPESIGDSLTQSTLATLALAEDTLNGRAALPALQQRNKKAGFFREDAFTNPVYNRNAFRVVLASLACYALISGADWSGISTAITTCLITALTTSSQSRQKQALRILGASVGAVLSFLAIVAVLPIFGGITVLTIVTAIITFLGAWVYASSPRLNYAGVQLVLCFYLGAFGEGKAPTSLTSVRDRVIGIFIGNLAMWLFYDRIEPVWRVSDSRRDVAKELNAIGIVASDGLPSRQGEMASSLIEHERQAFQSASTHIRTAADPNTYEFKLLNGVQRQAAPLLTSLQDSIETLFAFEYAAVEAQREGLPAFRDKSIKNTTPQTLAILATAVELGGAVASLQSHLHASDAPREEMLLAQVARECSRLYAFAADAD